ncbi:MAG TPA: protein kinase, partial [Gemmatimonadaceae bacterium]|nr:protein kinase [Gemmatimonadaceae bacterium]
MPDMRRCARCGASLADADPAGPCPACLLALGVTVRSPVQIGPYRILETLGEGGMGIVYLAEQDEPLRRRVAIKVIKLGMDTREVVARFESERQAVALMDHPNIASVYDAGATEDGRPYFVMEYVPGVPITDYCDHHRLDTRARLALFSDVCAAIQHAHQKGIIHRDLKPTNVLVMQQDGRAVPKVIDFGVAKAIDQRMTERTVFTAHGILVGTPEYMSPEQASLGEKDLDTRTDIYSLGVLLYELLVGALPFDVRGLRRAGYDELRRIIREEEPVRPSTRVDALGVDAAGIAECRHTDTTALRRQLRGDLDWITLKALDKDPARRYASASELAADLRRHLSDEAVMASPPSRSYRLRKLIRKNRGVASGIAATLIALLAGLVTSSALYLRSETARQWAEAEAARNQLDAQAMQAAFREDPSTYESLSEKAMTTHRRMLGPDNPALASHLVNYAVISEFVLIGRPTSKLEAVVNEALMLIERGLDGADSSVVAPLVLLSDSRFIDEDRMTRLRRQAFDLVLQEQQRGVPDAQEHANRLADLLETGTAESIPEEDLERAVHSAREILSLRQNARAGQREAVVQSLARLAVVLARNADRLLRAGHFVEAEAAYREAILRAKESGKFEESRLARIELDLGRCLLALKRFEEAEHLLTESHAVLWAKLGDRNAATQEARTGLAELYDALGRPADAAKYRERLPAIHVTKVSDRGTVLFVPRGSRDGGFSAAINGDRAWVFYDTSLAADNGQPARWLDASWGKAQTAIGGRALTVSSPIRAKTAPPDVPLIPRTEDETASDTARQSRACTEDCGSRWRFRPGPVIWDSDRKRTLVFYTKNFGPSVWSVRRVGASIALWPDFNGPAVRPVLRTGDQSALLFGPDEPGWGSGALAVGDTLYAYACDFHDFDGCLVARVPLSDALDRAAWRFYSGNGTWSENWRVARQVLRIPGAFSVHWNPYLG